MGKSAHGIALFLSEVVSAVWIFSALYWSFSWIDRSHVSVIESIFWAIAIVVPPLLIKRIWGARRAQLIWSPLVFSSYAIFQYWFLSLSDFFAIGKRVVFDDGFTYFGLFLVFVVPLLLVALCAFSVFLGTAAESALRRHLEARHP